ncbi:MAG: hypothetical protein AAF146_16335, partial [Bacteroidota bacterium]
MKSWLPGWQIPTHRFFLTSGLFWGLWLLGPVLAAQPSIDCTCRPDTLRHQFRFGAPPSHWQRQLVLPARGYFAQESHYLTNADELASGASFPQDVGEGIEAHLERSLLLYQQYAPETSLADLYPNEWQRSWTPSEMGAIGQGSIGRRQLEILEPATELWLLAMMWERGQRPAVGTLFLVRANNRAVVVVAGYETGPGPERYLGGLTPEVHHWLGTNAHRPIEIYRLPDGNFPVGPVHCASKKKMAPANG